METVYIWIFSHFKGFPYSFNIYTGKLHSKQGHFALHIDKFHIEPNEKPLIGKSGKLYICVVVWLFVLLVGCRHGGNSSDVTLAFEDAQVIQPLRGDFYPALTASSALTRT